MDDKNFILAVLLSVLILVGWNLFYEKPRVEAYHHDLAMQQQASKDTVAAAAPAPAVVASAALKPRQELIAAGFASAERVLIATPRLHGSINLRGGRIDDLTLADYRETIAPGSPEIVLLSPAGSADPHYGYYADFGWLAEDSAVALPGADTLWQTNGKQLSPETPLVLTWQNGQGLTFERTLAIDDYYLFTVTDSVKNASGHAVTLYPYGLTARNGVPPLSGSTLLHEGALGVFGGTLDEIKYAKLIQAGTVEHTSTGGWFGFTDKYWLVAMAPETKSPLLERFTHLAQPGAQTAESAGSETLAATVRHKYQADYRAGNQALADGGTITNTVRVFAGAKQVRLLDRYTRRFGIENFDLAIDFGWFYFLTKPFFYALNTLAALFSGTGYGFGLAILVFTIILKLLFFPMQNRAYESMSRMKLLNPQVEEVKVRFKDDKMRMNQEVMELYKREKVNPLSGCLPVLIQIPVFFALYKVLYITIEMRQAPFFGWIHDLSAPDPTTIFNLFGLIAWTPPAPLMIGAWPVMMGLTMYAQQKLNPPAGDPVQQRMFEFLPLIFTFTLSKFPSGLVIYWAWSNLLSIAQQWVIARKTKLRGRLAAKT